MGSPDNDDVLRSLRRELGAPRRVERAEGTSSRPSRRTGFDGLERHGLLQQSGAGDGDEEWVKDQQDFTLFDPVWGPPDYPPGHKMRPCQVLGVLCCPCCMGKGGCCNEKNKAVWRRIRWRAATVLCVVQTLVFAVSIIVNGGFQPLLSGPEPNPLLGPSAETLVKMGAKLLILIREKYQLWRLATPMLLHGGLLHLLMNMLSQFRLGIFLEETWGSRRWLTVYCIGGVCGNLLSCVCSPLKAGVGASGAVYGLMGGWLSHVLCTWDEEDDFGKVGQLLQVVGYSVLGMAMSLAPIVDWAAHLGGFLGGAMVGWHMFYKPPPQLNVLMEPRCTTISRRQGSICAWVAGFAMAAMFVGMFVMQMPEPPQPER